MAVVEMIGVGWQKVRSAVLLQDSSNSTYLVLFVVNLIILIFVSLSTTSYCYSSVTFTTNVTLSSTFFTAVYIKRNIM